MEKEPVLYPNIVKFLISNSFLVKSIDTSKIEAGFPGDEVENTFKKFREIRKKADIENNQEIANNLYRESWKILNAVEKRYFPKLQPILELLNIFYRNRDTPLEFRIFFENWDIHYIDLSFNKLYFEMYSDKDLFMKNVTQEFIDLDNFIKTTNKKQPIIKK